MLDTLALQWIRICSTFCDFPVREKVMISSINADADFGDWYSPSTNVLISTHCLLNPFTLDWSRNLLHILMWNMAVNNISYSIYLFSTKIEEGYTTKIIPFFFFVQYIKINIWYWHVHYNTNINDMKFMRLLCICFLYNGSPQFGRVTKRRTEHQAAIQDR